MDTYKIFLKNSVPNYLVYLKADLFVKQLLRKHGMNQDRRLSSNMTFVNAYDVQVFCLCWTDLLSLHWFIPICLIEAFFFNTDGFTSILSESSHVASLTSQLHTPHTWGIMPCVLIRLFPSAIFFLPDNNFPVIGTGRQDISIHRMSPGNLPHGTFMPARNNESWKSWGKHVPVVAVSQPSIL